MELTEEFCKKRIQEQKDYITKVQKQALDKEIDMSRSLEIIRSALSQLEYFTQKLQILQTNNIDTLEFVGNVINKKLSHE